MGLFTNRPQLSDPVNYVTIGLNKTLLIVGLGNVGKDYVDTRHNIGFAAVDAFVDKREELGGWTEKKSLKCYEANGKFGQSKVVVIKPTTMMNLSGQAVQAVAHFYKIQPSNILVVHDEIDVKFGQIRTRTGGSSAGHNGIKSITQALGSDNYGRVRIGIGPKKPEQVDSADFVLAKFSSKEQADMAALTKETNAILSEYAYGGQLNAETRSFLF